MGEDLGLFALNGQKPQTTDMMETDVMTGQEFKQMVERMHPRLMQMGREFFGSDTISSVRNTLRTALRRRFFTPRQLMSIIIFTIALGLAVASALNPNGVVRGAIEHVLGIPEDTTIYEYEDVEVKPTYRKDIYALYRHLAAEIHYPDSAMAKGIEGRVIIRFVVEKDGHLSNFEVLRTPDNILNEEAIRVLRKTESWIPAQNRGRPVRCNFCMPVVSRIK